MSMKDRRSVTSVQLHIDNNRNTSLVIGAVRIVIDLARDFVIFFSKLADMYHRIIIGIGQRRNGFFWGQN